MAPEKGAVKTAARSWAAHGLPEWSLQAVSSLGFAEPTPVQQAVLPLFLANSDVVVEAPTGSGKTISYLLPVCARILRLEPTRRHHVAAVIVSPTRELAVQIHGVLLSLLAFHPPSAAVLPYLGRHEADERRPATSDAVVVPQLVVGGVGKPATDLAFFLRHSPNCLVATPGRLAELLASPHVNATGSFEMLVLDEADRILDLGFANDLQRILSFVPKQRRTGLFSASVTDALSEIIKVNLRNPKRVVVRVRTKDGAVVEEKKTPASLQMAYLVVPPTHKIPALVQLLERLAPRPQRSIVFISCCYSVKYFALVLPSILPDGFTAIPLHGKMEPAARQKAFAKFASSSAPCVLLTTDLASRGLDIPAVDLVVNLDPPGDPKTFIHRCGRTGRAGRRGLAVTMLLEGREEDFVALLDVRGTPMAPLARPAVAVTAAEAEAATEAIRAQARADRDIYQLSQRAFVSFVRAYQEHRATSIFRAADLDLVELARAFGLLRLPRMPEVRAAKIEDRSLGLAGVDVDAIPFRDETKEKRRQAELAERAAAPGEPAGRPAPRRGGRKNEAWSDKHDRDDVRVARREKKRRRREAEREAHMTDREKEEKRQLDELLVQVRGQRQTAASDDEFRGFGD